MIQTAAYLSRYPEGCSELRTRNSVEASSCWLHYCHAKNLTGSMRGDSWAYWLQLWHHNYFRFYFSYGCPLSGASSVPDTEAVNISQGPSKADIFTEITLDHSSCPLPVCVDERWLYLAVMKQNQRLGCYQSIVQRWNWLPSLIENFVYTRLRLSGGSGHDGMSTTISPPIYTAHFNYTS